MTGTTQGLRVAGLAAEARGAFLVRTYLHLLAAILAFATIEAFLFASGLAYPIAVAMLGTSWLLVLGAFIVVGWLARGVAHRTESLGAQYAALAGYVLVEALIFVPLLAIAQVTLPGALTSAALVTLVGFGLLTGMVLWTRQDLSFLGGLLGWLGILALCLIVAGSLFGLELGVYFSVAMVGLAGAAILYDTSQVLHHYSEDRYVAAALELFASVALMFWYVLRLFLASRE